MLTSKQVKLVVEIANPGFTVEVVVPYKGIFLVRGRHASEGEEDFDPFFSVDPKTGEVKEFSVLTDGDPLEIAAAFSAVSE